MPPPQPQDLQLDRDTVASAIRNPPLRRQLVKRFGFWAFCLLYLSHYFELEPADFFPDLIRNVDDDTIDALLIIGFRGSAKSTFVSTAYVIYAALEKPDLYPFIVCLTSTGDLATATIAAVKFEFETNALLREDYGVPMFEKVRGISWEVRKKLESKEEWQQRNLVLATGIRILARSRGQRIRGIRHRTHRIKLAIGDDIDDLKSVATQESRNSTAQWWRGEVVGALAIQSRRILIGNWLHLDGLMARMKDSKRYKVLEYSLFREGPGTEWERCTWKAAYPNQEAIDKKRQDMGEIAFLREMLLKVVPEEGQDILPEDIHYYDDPPFDDGNYLAHGGDLAISTQQSADCTALVTGEVAFNPDLEIYVQPHPLNERITFHQTVDRFDDVRHSSKMHSKFFIEGVAYQMAAVQEMARRAFDVVAIRPLKDKRARLRVAARYVKNGTVKFPRKGCEALIQQLLGFGIEKHDDLVDAFVSMVLGVAEDGIEQQVVSFVQV